MIYNRISTVLGGEVMQIQRGGATLSDTTTEEAAAPQSSDPKSDKIPTKENAVWYEYGCV